MGKTWVLDTETKGTGANIVPLEKVERKPEEASRPTRRSNARRGSSSPRTSAERSTEHRRQKTASALPPGHVRRKATGEIGKVLSVEPKAGTASVRWLKRGATSTVQLSAISRR